MSDECMSKLMTMTYAVKQRINKNSYRERHSEFLLQFMGGDLGGLGDGPPNLRWGTAQASAPPIFWEVLLWDVRQSTNWLRKGVMEEYFVSEF